MNSVYSINKGINKSIEFKGLKAQYIWYLGAGVILLMILFAGLFILGLPSVISMILIGGLGAFWVVKVYALSRKYGQYGMMKALARRQLPTAVRCRNRDLFMNKGRMDYGKETGRYLPDTGNQ